MDEEDGVYVTGQSYSSNPSFNSDFATVKYNATNGEQVWVRRYDGGYNLSDEAHAIAVDNAGGVYVTGGATYSSDDYNGKDFVTFKYRASDGEQVWMARYDGGYGYDAAIALVLDRENGVYVAGYSTGEYNKVSFSTIKYDSQNGSQLWAKRFDNPSGISGMAVDYAGGVYISGYSSLMSSDQEFQAKFLTVKYEASDGEQAWAQTYGEGLSVSRAYDITTDSVGGVYVTGQTITGAGNEGAGAVATLKYNSSDGAILWEVLKEGIDEEGRTISLDELGNVYVSGSSFSNRTYGDFLTIKYSQNGGCTPVVAQGITGPSTVRAGTQDASYTLAGTGADTFNWTVSGEQTVPISGQGTGQVMLDWPTEAGMYEVRASYSAGEACLAQDTTLTVAVFDPNAGFVIGAGWFDSPVNPALPYMQVGGRLHFAFASWYAKDARTVPGYTVFRFSSGGLDFRSAAHTPMRLVISGDMANYTGLGIVNGMEGYGFLVAAVDGDVGQGHQRDRLRLKIWEIASGRVVYDNQAGAGEGAVASTAIEGGQIVIHRPLGRSLENLAALAEGMSEGSVPEKHVLQAYPTIFSGKATVTFTLDQEQEYTLGLYDMNGTLVRNVGSGRAGAGRQYEFVVNEERLSNGLYFVRLIAGAEVQTVKLLLSR
ncbi:T9SS type A sorting domain-containing protein [Pontibacter toksunensis]|uniref:T9SS type A sorting domain-containing protein n=1 Tax=Pontibacter toksunensis TaxID=1332631 RepID=A0ABW6BYN9_9BACT